jgi:PadR family transcriptional regulator, regulatory protein PadR
MGKRTKPPFPGEMLQGTLDLLILKTLALGPAHGQSVATVIERTSDDFLQVEHGSLYPSLYRLEDRRWISSSWGVTENNRKAKYYQLTPAGRKQLAEQTSHWDNLVRAMSRILHPAKD